jgi:hypothetical protein
VLVKDFSVVRGPFQKILLTLVVGHQGNAFAVFHDDIDIMVPLFSGF